MTSRDLKVGAVIVAAGSGQRFGDESKVLVPVAGKPMIIYSLELFASVETVKRIVVVAGPHSMERVSKVVAASGQAMVEVCLGGATRRESVQRGFERMPNDLDLVAIHDAARPLATTEMVLSLIEAAATSGAAVPVLPVSDTIYQLGDAGEVDEIVDRSRLRAAQTPQVARREWLAEALGSDEAFTDEGSALVGCGYDVTTVAGHAENIKITWPEDVRLAEVILHQRALS